MDSRACVVCGATDPFDEMFGVCDKDSRECVDVCLDCLEEYEQANPIE